MKPYSNLIREVFVVSSWKFDLISSLLFSLIFGWFIQIAADSGQRAPLKVLFSIVICGLSFVLIYALSILVNQDKIKTPSWIWIGVLGSVVYAFNRQVVVYLYHNWQFRQSDSIGQYLSWVLPSAAYAFIVSCFLFTFLDLGCIFAGRIVRVILLEFWNSDNKFR